MRSPGRSFAEALAQLVRRPASLTPDSGVKRFGKNYAQGASPPCDPARSAAPHPAVRDLHIRKGLELNERAMLTPAEDVSFTGGKLETVPSMHGHLHVKCSDQTVTSGLCFVLHGHGMQAKQMVEWLEDDVCGQNAHLEFVFLQAPVSWPVCGPADPKSATGVAASCRPRPQRGPERPRPFLISLRDNC